MKRQWRGAEKVSKMIDIGIEERMENFKSAFKRSVESVTEGILEENVQEKCTIHYF